jgi:hypothetical protein
MVADLEGDRAAGIPPAFSASGVVGFPNSAARSIANASWAYGFSVDSVPSLSKTAIRSTSGTNASDEESVTASTNSTIEAFAGVSRQLASRSAIPSPLLYWRGIRYAVFFPV